MNKLREKIRKYFQTSSVWKIGSDMIFYLFIILMIIPATRKPISTAIIKATMRKPKLVSEASAPLVQPQDWSMTFMDMEGKHLRLEDFRNEVILLNFWATWCPPCRAEMPSLQALYNDYGKKITILLVSTESQDVIMDFLKENEYDFPAYIQRSPFTESFRVNSIPTTYLIARNGRIVSSKTGAANWNSEAFRKELDGLISE